MTDAEFLDIYKATLVNIEAVVEDAINDLDADLDYESGNDMLTLQFNDGSVAIISRQSAIHQLWLAAKSGGFHFDWDAAQQQWLCSIDSKPLPEMLSAICLAQGAVTLSFS